MIAILCPTRGRPEQFKKMFESTIWTEAFVYAGFTEGDEGYGAIGYKNFHFPDSLPTVHKWNLLAGEAIKNPDIKLFMLGADDMIFDTPGWDKALIDYYNNLENKIHVYALQDSRDPEGTPHPIVTREYIEAMGYFVPPIFLHWFIDSWTVDIARSNNCFTHLKDFLLVHDKPSDKGQADETHSRIRQWGWHERDKWVAEKCGSWLRQQKLELGRILRGSITEVNA